jgi:non-specific serine/threonine protein kinase
MSHDEPRHNLPARLSSFVGRERELTEVARLLEDARLVTLVGAPGVGKTRLALQVAEALRRRFSDGIWFIELAALAEPALVANAVAATLGVHDDPRRPPLTALADHLGGRRVLLVLDNCEHLVAACAELAEARWRATPA